MVKEKNKDKMLGCRSLFPLQHFELERVRSVNQPKFFISHHY